MKKFIEKFKRFYKWTIGLLIPVAFAAPLALPLEDTIYKIEWKQRFVNEQNFIETIARRPDMYEHYSVVDNPKEGYEIILWREFAASTTEEAVSKARDIEKTRYLFSNLEAKTIYGTYYEKYLTGGLEENHKQKIDSENIFGFLSFFPKIALAGFPTDDLESYGDGTDLDGGNGGTGWTEAWGDTTACHVDINTLSTPTLAGTRTAGGTNVTNAALCVRGFTANTTDNAAFSFIVRQTNVALSNRFLDFRPLQNTTLELLFALYEDGNINVTDDTVFVSQGVYTGDTNYTLTFEMDYTNEQYRVKINSGSFSSWYKMYSYGSNVFTQTNNYRFLYNSSPQETDAWFDDFKDATAVATGAELYESGSFFQLLQGSVKELFVYFIKFAYAKN